VKQLGWAAARVGKLWSVILNNAANAENDNYAAAGKDQRPVRCLATTAIRHALTLPSSSPQIVRVLSRPRCFAHNLHFILTR